MGWVCSEHNSTRTSRRGRCPQLGHQLPGQGQRCTEPGRWDEAALQSPAQPAECSENRSCKFRRGWWIESSFEKRTHYMVSSPTNELITNTVLEFGNIKHKAKVSPFSSALNLLPINHLTWWNLSYYTRSLYSMQPSPWGVCLLARSTQSEQGLIFEDSWLYTDLS